MKKSFFIFCILSILSVSFAAERLGVFVDENRFMGQKGTTQLEINYSLPYYTLDFIKQQYGYEAEIFVDISVLLGEKLISSDSFTNKVVIRDAQKMFSDEVYLDKITITLPAYDFVVNVGFTDTHTEATYLWSGDFVSLDIDCLTSDLELSTSIEADTTLYLDKFHRDDNLYLVKPDHTFITNQEEIYFYQEFYNLYQNDEQNYDMLMEIELTKDESVVDNISLEFSAPWEEIVKISDKISISEYEEGLYGINITYTDQVIGTKSYINDSFLLKTSRINLQRFFPEIEDDFKFAGYFLNVNQKNIWKSLTMEGKMNYLDKFWKFQDPNPTTEENEFLLVVEERIDYANANYSHFKPGWTSDMGRIYIRYGLPYEVSKLNTNLGENQFSEYSDYDAEESQSANYFNKYTIKNYQIWKYRMSKNANYIFIDMMNSGDYKLIYSSDDDDGESSLPDWRRYLGYDFDDRLMD